METVEANAQLLKWAEGKDLSQILKRVNQFINLAEGSNLSPPDSPEWHATNEEQKRARANADLLMEAYMISEAMREAAKPSAERIRPVSDVFEGGNGDLQRYVDRLAEMIARFTRTKIRWHVQWIRETHSYNHKIYGYEGDVRYFQFLYTTLRLHFLGALQPEIDSALSLDENCYVLHNAGFGWHEIAKMYGWKTHRETEYGDRIEDYLSDREAKDLYGSFTEIWTSPEGERWDGETRILMRKWRTPYFRECKKRGEEPILNISQEAFRIAAGDGYINRIRERLREVEEGRKLSGGSALAIRIEDLEQFMREEMGNCTRCPACGKLSLYDWHCDICGNEDGMPGKKPEPIAECPKCKKAKSGACRDHSFSAGRIRYLKHSEAGYQAGRSRANSADLGGQRMSGSKKAID